MDYETSLTVGDRQISIDTPTYFIADIAANHDGDLQRAKDLIWKAKEAGADVAKFQHFLAKDIISDFGFRNLDIQTAHQAAWKKPVYEIYEDYELNRDWNTELSRTCSEVGIEFMTTPYDLAAIDGVNGFVRAYKIGSGDITWTNLIEAVARRAKPVFLATGASTQDDVARAVDAVLRHTRKLCLMQCNTNYQGLRENFQYVNLNVLRTFAAEYPGMVLGLSDHSPGHAAVLGAITLGARVVEKHFTDDNSREGPDHGFSMTPSTWNVMVEAARELEAALGDGVKRVEDNEIESAIVQRRCLRLRRDLKAGDVLTEDDLECLRPIPDGSLEPYRINDVTGKLLRRAKQNGDALYASDLES